MNNDNKIIKAIVRFWLDCKWNWEMLSDSEKKYLLSKYDEKQIYKIVPYFFVEN